MTDKEVVFWAVLGKSWIVIAAYVYADARWWSRKRFCKSCGDIATEGTALSMYCQDCWDEITGRDNGEKFLARRGKGHAGRRLESDAADGGPSGRFGYRGHNNIDNAVRALEEDR